MTACVKKIVEKYGASSGFPVLSSGSLCWIETFDSIQNWSPAQLVYMTTHLRLAFATFDFCSAHPKNLRNHQLKLQACCRSTLQALYIFVYCDIYIYTCICTLSEEFPGSGNLNSRGFHRPHLQIIIIYMHIYVATKEIKREIWWWSDFKLFKHQRCKDRQETTDKLTSSASSAQWGEEQWHPSPMSTKERLCLWLCPG